MPELLFAFYQTIRNETENGQDHGILQCCNQRYGCHGQSLVRYVNLMPSAEPGASARWTLAIALLSEAGIFSTSFKVNKVPASNRANAAVDGQFTLQANLLGGLKHVETLLNEEDDYCRY